MTEDSPVPDPPVSEDARPRARRRRRRPRRLRTVLTALVVIGAAVAFGLSRCKPAPTTVTVVAAGNLACDPDDPQFQANSDAEGDRCRQDEVSAVAVGLEPDAFIGLGDFQFELPSAEAYHDVYQPTWGRLLTRTIPVFGNQEYKVQDANTFTAYFGKQIRDPRGYWSQDLGKWHIVVLNSNCAAVDGGCGDGSPQQKWLAADLSHTARTCVLAAWHHPRWSTGIAGNDARTGSLYRTLYEHKVEVVLSAHDADYERFATLDPKGAADPHGVTEFVVGTGGQAHYEPDAAVTLDENGNPVTNKAVPGSAFHDYDHHGVLKLVLRPGGYEWSFHPLEHDVEDTGSASCF